MNNIVKWSLHARKNVNKFIKVTYSTKYNPSYKKNKLSQTSNASNDNNQKKSSNNNDRKTLYKVLSAAAAVAGIGIGYYILENKRNNIVFNLYGTGTSLKKSIKNVENDDDIDIIPGVYDPNLPVYKFEDIKKHTSPKNGIWVIYKEGVYDITEFAENHPGGKIILKAAGGSLEPFWNIYGIHKNSSVYSMLEELRIGNISKEESEDLTKHLKDPYLLDPERPSSIKAISVTPFNGEPYPPKILVDSYITPVDKFYIRNHLPVPVIDPETYKLEIEIENTDKKITLTLDDLKKFEKKKVTAALMCAGNRRSEMNEVKEVKGLDWGNAVIGNAVWSGVYLRDILLELGIDDESNYKHVQFTGFDHDPSVENRFYGASVPYNFVMNKLGQVLLTYEMNGEPLTRDHGFPVRVIVPGVCGARNVKWLKKIIVSNDESPAFWQRNDYKTFNPSIDFDSADYSKAQAILNLPVTSAICVPQAGNTVKLENGYITVKGYAFSGGGNKIYRVDVTADKGETWHSAILEAENIDPPQHYCWSLWTAKIPVKHGAKEVEIWAKAMDSNHNTQPESFVNIWNMRGVLANAYQRVRVKICK